MGMILRKAEPGDKPKVFEVEAKSMPSLQYLPHLFDEWYKEKHGDLSVVELDGEVIGVGKYTRMPDGSAWIEALRVTPEKQGLGAGKCLYEHWFELARQQGVSHMRMYTNISNVKSKGLAERFGLRVEGTYREATLPIKDSVEGGNIPSFKKVLDWGRAVRLLMPQAEKWGGFLVMNRTFYRINPVTCAYLSEKGMLYEDEKSGSIVTLGARFMPWQSLHIGVMAGDYDACLRFALRKGAEKKVERLNLLFPPILSDVEAGIMEFGYKRSREDFITMGTAL